MKVTSGKKVKIEYTISVEGVGVIESSESRGPLEYIHGSNSLPLGLEPQLEGLGVGDTKEGSFTVEIPTMEMKKSEFPDSSTFEKGARFTGKNATGEVEFVIEEVKEKAIVVRPHHPLAGKTLSYKMKVLDVGEG